MFLLDLVTSGTTTPEIFVIVASQMIHFFTLHMWEVKGLFKEIVLVGGRAVYLDLLT